MVLSLTNSIWEWLLLLLFVLLLLLPSSIILLYIFAIFNLACSWAWRSIISCTICCVANWVYNVDVVNTEKSIVIYGIKRGGTSHAIEGYTILLPWRCFSKFSSLLSLLIDLRCIICTDVMAECNVEINLDYPRCAPLSWSLSVVLVTLILLLFPLLLVLLLCL